MRDVCRVILIGISGLFGNALKGSNVVFGESQLGKCLQLAEPKAFYDSGSVNQNYQV